ARAEKGFEARQAALVASLTRRNAPQARIDHKVDQLRARYGLSAGAGLAMAADRHAEHASAMTWLQRAYVPTLRWSLGHRLITLLLALVVFGGTMALAPQLKTDFIGEAGATSLQITQQLPGGASLQEMDEAAKKVEALIAAEPTVESYSTLVGTASGSFSFGGNASDTNKASHSITLKAKSPGLEVADRLRAQIAEDPSVGSTEVTVGRQSGGIIVYVETPDQAKLATANQQVLDLLSGIDGLSNVASDLTEAKSLLSVDVDEEAAADAGMTQAQIGGAALRAIRGQKVGTMISGESSMDVVLRSQTPVRDIDELRQILLPVTQKQTIDARTKAADKVTAASEAFAAKQKADGTKSFNESLKAIRDSRAKAAKQLDALLGQLKTLRRALSTPIPTLPPGVLPPIDPYAQVKAQIAQVEAAITGSRAQIKALDTQYDKAVEGRQKGLDTQAESEALQDAGKEAAKAKAKPLKLHQVSDVKQVQAPASISRVDGARTATVTASPSGNDLGGTTAAITAGLADLKLPPGVTVRVGGVSQQQQESFTQLGLAMLVAIAIVYLIMVATFGSLLQPLILLVAIPFAATGAIGLSLATDTPLGVPSMIGLLMLIGIVVTNAIVLIDLINQYRRDGAGIDDAIMHGARLRLRPIIMTALATIMALVPMGLGVTGGGVFISKPLAIVVIGGLVSSTVLTLILVPVLYDLVERVKERAGRRRAAAEPDAAPEPVQPGAAPADAGDPQRS
ncbi:MAG: efflux RND transporter permease subunit, partial [Micropruina sp.]